VPGTLLYRDLSVRVVAAACKFVRSEEAPCVPGGSDAPPKSSGADDFDNQVVSAFGEAFNNTCIHGYRDREAGDIDIVIETSPNRIVITMRDTGETFDPMTRPPLSLGVPRESGMGVHIMRSFMDVTYQGGSPNVLCLAKHRDADARLAEDSASAQGSKPT